MIERPRAARPSRSLLTLALLAPAVPLVVALVARHGSPWVPDLDLALTELRVRDVGGRHSPLVGLPGRFGTFERQGSHPGPLGFYALAPLYRLLGASSFALQAATVALHVAGAWVAVGLVARRAGQRWALGVGVALTALIGAIGPDAFTEPWNPHLPLLWWPAFLVAIWCTMTGVARALPVAVVAGSLCAQTHISHLAPVGVLTVLAAAAVLARPAATGPPHRGRWVLAAAGLGALLWLPPVLDQVRNDPGNAEIVVDHLLHAEDVPVGIGSGARLVLEHLDLWQLGQAAVVDPGRLGADYPDGREAWRGAVLLAAWAAVAAATWRGAPRSQRVLHLLGAALLGLALASVSRILGYAWGYLLLWLWSLAGVLVLAVLAAAATRWPASGRRLPLVLGLLAVGVAGRAAVAGAGAEPASPVLSRTVAALTPEVVELLEPDGHYVVVWTDALNLGGHGYGLFDELERRGVDVSVPEGLATQFGRHRVATPGSVDATLVVATGPAIAEWEAVEGTEVLARLDARTPGERRDAAAVRRELIAHLDALGLEDLVPVVDENLYAVAFDARLDRAAQALVARLGALGAPAAVLLAPVGAVLP